MKLNCLVTGGAGFIGSHLCESLIESGHKVTVLDNFRTGFKQNIEKLDLQLVQGDIRNPYLVEELADGCNVIFHLAALISDPQSLNLLRDCIDVNTHGTLNLLEAAKNNPGCKVVLSSSAVNYGNNPQCPKHESMRPEPASPYAVTKLDGEYYLDIYNKHWQIPTTSLRYFSVFGPRQSLESAYTSVIPILITRALRNEPIHIYGNGTQTRDFVFVKDVVKANLLAYQCGDGTYNIASGKPITILEIAKMIKRLTNSRSPIKMIDVSPGDILNTQADVSKISALGFTPNYSLQEALVETIAYYDDQMSIEASTVWKADDNENMSEWLQKVFSTR